MPAAESAELAAPRGNRAHTAYARHTLPHLTNGRAVDQPAGGNGPLVVLGAPEVELALAVGVLSGKELASFGLRVLLELGMLLCWARPCPGAHLLLPHQVLVQTSTV